MVFVVHNPVTMARVEDKPGTAKKRWRLEDGPTPPTGFVVVVPPERGSNSNGVPI